MEGRCRGHCCRCFELSVPYEELKTEPSRFTDGNQILGMLIYLGALTHEESRKITGNTVNDEASTDEPEDRFTCKNLQENGDCGIYENRPWMCRSYPNVAACEYKECQASCSVLTAVREKGREVVFGDVKDE